MAEARRPGRARRGAAGRGRWLAIALAGLGVALLSSTQEWVRQWEVDAAGLSFQRVLTGGEVAPVAGALLLTAGAALLAALALQGRWAVAAMMTSALAALGASAAVALSAGPGRTGWWWLALASGFVASVALVLAVLASPSRGGPASGSPSGSSAADDAAPGRSSQPTAYPPSSTTPTVLPPHEARRRADAAAWAALSDGADPTCGPTPQQPGAAGTMSVNDRPAAEEEPHPMHEDSHGHSTAAWSGVIIMLVGTLVACWGVVYEPDVLLWVGVGLGVVGALAWYVLDKAGFGEQAHG